MAGRRERIRWAEAGGYAIALAGVVAAVTFDAAISVYYLSTAVMVLALVPVMLGFYQLGGRTPVTPARAALGVGVLAAVLFASLLIGASAGFVSVDASRPAEGPLAILSIAMVVFGLWLVGAPTLAGPWLTAIPRWLGVLCGVAWAFEGTGLLLAGSQNPLTTIGGIGVQVLFPIWGVFIGRRIAAIRFDLVRRSELSQPVEG